MAWTQEQYEQARTVMGKCPIPLMGNWIEQTMDLIAETYDFDRAIIFARTLLDVGVEDPVEFMDRARSLLNDIEEDLETIP